MRYCEEHSSPQNDVLYKLERETNLKTLAPQMLSGAYQGRLLNMLCLLAKPKLALEIGTFTAYGSLQIADALGPESLLHTIEAKIELKSIIEKYVSESGLKEKVRCHFGDAKRIIPEFEEKFDFCYIDAGKKDNSEYYEMLMPKLNPGALIVVDNVLWSGKVVNAFHDNDTSQIHAFNQLVQNDNRVTNILLPVRDGIMLAIKKEN